MARIRGISSVLLVRAPRVGFESVDAMRVVNGKITEHWGVANLYSVMQPLGAIAPLPQT
jgi:hypothetical protein